MMARLSIAQDRDRQISDALGNVQRIVQNAAATLDLISRWMLQDGGGQEKSALAVAFVAEALEEQLGPLIKIANGELADGNDAERQAGKAVRP